MNDSGRTVDRRALSVERAAALTLLDRARQLDAPVLLLGEAGSGKTHWARQLAGEAPPLELHGPDACPRRISEAVSAGPGASCVIERVSRLPLPAQAALELALDRVARPARLICTDDRWPEAGPGALSWALVHRLDVIRVVLPPLRGRPEDVRALALELLPGLRGGSGLPEGISGEAFAALTQHHWPGNVRELRAVLQGAVAVSGDRLIRVSDLPDSVRASRSAEPASARLPYRSARRQALTRFEREYWVAVLTRLGGNVTHAAREAGVHRKTVQKAIERYQLRRTVAR